MFHIFLFMSLSILKSMRKILFHPPGEGWWNQPELCLFGVLLEEHCLDKSRLLLLLFV